MRSGGADAVEGLRRICLALPETTAALFRPPYVGHRGWLGVRIDDVEGRGPDWDVIAVIVREAYRVVAPRTLADRLED